MYSFEVYKVIHYITMMPDNGIQFYANKYCLNESHTVGLICLKKDDRLTDGEQTKSPLASQ